VVPLGLEVFHSGLAWLKTSIYFGVLKKMSNFDQISQMWSRMTPAVNKFNLKNIDIDQ